MKKAVRRKKYFAPQNEDNQQRRCDCPGCNAAGEYRAPKDRSLKEYYWFCLKHVQEYNAKWNYYDGIDEEEMAGEDKPRNGRKFNHFSSKIKYNYGFGFSGNFDFFGEYASGFEESEIESVFYTAQEKAYIRIMEIELSELSVEKLKSQYKKLVKKYHPDLNRDDKDAEEKFKQLGTAYKTLMNKISPEPSRSRP